VSDLLDVSASLAGELVVEMLTGAASVEYVAEALELPPGQLFGWCDRIKAAYLVDPVNGPLWVPESGVIDVVHTVDCESPACEGAKATFTVTVTNNTRTTLYGVRLVPRSFSNSQLDDLRGELRWRRTETTVTPLEPGSQHCFRATYELTMEDSTPGNDLINAIAITGFTATGQRFYAEQDAILEFPENSPL
jgi:hypothetical protein